jgi:CRISPR-associated protein Csm2
MRPIPMEEKLLNEWGLGSDLEISDRIFKGYSEGEKLSKLLDGDTLVACSYALGKRLAGREVGLKTSQLRRFYGAIMDVKATINRSRTAAKVADGPESEFRIAVRKLKPQLANAAARQTPVKPFFNVVNPMLDTIQDVDDFRRFCDFVEAVVAYHKYCGGRD